MITHRTTFDWTAWYAKIPGIPVDWGFSSLADPSAVSRPTPAESEARYMPLKRNRLRLRLAR
jgi:hypothetical protein